MKNKVRILNIGLKDYKETWDFQEEVFNQAIQLKIQKRKGETDELPTHHLIFCEHPHVYTLGKSGSVDNLLIDEQRLKEKNATFYKINRGGDITYHGPGQLVVYPIFDLDQFFTDIHKYMRYLEEVVILTLQEFGITAGRVDGLTGVWVGVGSPFERKICAMGVKASRWITMHGLALNINPDLSYFSNIIPCGIDDKAVTSMEKECVQTINFNEVKEVLKQKMAEVFDLVYI